jgi:hypothetical protein
MIRRTMPAEASTDKACSDCTPVFFLILAPSYTCRFVGTYKIQLLFFSLMQADADVERVE